MEPDPFSIGRDHVVPQEDGTLLVFSKEPKEETWRLRKFRRTRIVVRGEGYFLAQIRDGGGACDLVYVLAPWPKGTSDLPGAVVEYDDSYVKALRQKWEHIHRVERPLGFGMLLASPILGLAWDRTKRRWEEAYGTAALRLTQNSIYVEGAFGGVVVLLKTILFTVMAFAGGFGQGASFLNIVPTWLFVVSLVLAFDALLRYQAVQEVPPRLYGFLEYVFSREPLSVSVPEQPVKALSPDSEKPSEAKEKFLPPEKKPTALS